MDESSILSYSNGKRINRTKKKTPSIAPEISHKGLNDEIIQRADAIYDILSAKVGVKRKIKRQKLLFYCVLAAHLEIGKPHDAIDIGKLFGLTPDNIHNTYTLFSYSQTGYKLRIVDHVICFIEYFCIKIDLLDSNVDEIRELYDEIKEKEEFEDMRARNLAAGLLDYYLTSKGFGVDNLPEVVHLPAVSIKKTSDMIYTEFNS